MSFPAHRPCVLPRPEPALRTPRHPQPYSGHLPTGDAPGAGQSQRLSPSSATSDGSGTRQMAITAEDGLTARPGLGQASRGRSLSPAPGHSGLPVTGRDERGQQASSTPSPLPPAVGGRGHEPTQAPLRSGGHPLVSTLRAAHTDTGTPTAASARAQRELQLELELELELELCRLGCPSSPVPSDSKATLVMQRQRTSTMDRHAENSPRINALTR